MKIEICKPPEACNPKDWDFRLVTWFGSGRVRPASGTVGTLAALPPGVAILWIAGPVGLALAALILFIAGKRAVTNFERKSGLHDARMVVVDEVVGMWICLLPTGMNPALWLVAFLLFRLFDVMKPWPVSWADRKLTGASAVMWDDVLAALYALPGVMAAAFIETQLHVPG